MIASCFWNCGRAGQEPETHAHDVTRKPEEGIPPFRSPSMFCGPVVQNGSSMVASWKDLERIHKCRSETKAARFLDHLYLLECVMVRVPLASVRHIKMHGSVENIPEQI